MKLPQLLFITLIALAFQYGHADETGLPLHGFADVVAGSSSTDTPEIQRLRGVAVGTIDLYLTPEFEGGVKSLMEIAIEPDSADGTTGIDVERLQVGYSFGDAATLWVGRYHTPYGFWNTAFHHGAQLQTSIYRPRFIDFEDKGGILPAHSVGAWLHGNVKVVSDHRIVYDIYTGNGPRIINAGTAGSKQGELDPNLMRADREGSLMGMNLGWKFGGFLDGLTVGLHGFSTLVNSYAGDGNYDNNRVAGPLAQSDVKMTGGYLSYEGEWFDIDAEYYGFAVKNYDFSAKSWSGSVGSSASFVQIAGNFGAGGAIHPFARAENTSINASPDNSFFTNQVNAVSGNRYSFGVHYDINNKAALKVEWMHTKLAEQTPNDVGFDTYATQYAIRF